MAREVAALAAHLDFRVTVLDDREDLANRDRFPTAETVICDSYRNLSGYLEPDACYVVVTPDHKADLQCVSTILPTKYRYLGMIGSKRKVATAAQTLREDGFTEAQIQSIRGLENNPINIMLLALDGEEIVGIATISSTFKQGQKMYSKYYNKIIEKFAEG